MTKIAIGIATVFLGLMAACAVDSGQPADPKASTSSATSETSADLLKPGPIHPNVCLPFYMGAGSYYQCASTEQWYLHSSTCVENCPEHACSFDWICGPDGCTDCYAN